MKNVLRFQKGKRGKRRKTFQHLLRFCMNAEQNFSSALYMPYFLSFSFTLILSDADADRFLLFFKTFNILSSVKLHSLVVWHLFSLFFNVHTRTPYFPVSTKDQTVDFEREVHQMNSTVHVEPVPILIYICQYFQALSSEHI